MLNECEGSSLLDLDKDAKDATCQRSIVLGLPAILVTLANMAVEFVAVNLSQAWCLANFLSKMYMTLS
jgi:hypothetical protein